MFTVTIDEVGLDQIVTRLTALAEFVADPITPAKAEIVEWFHKVEKEQFSSEGSAGSTGKWPKLEDRYAAWKSKHYPGAKILERTRRLLESLTTENGDSIIESSPNQLILGSNVPYGIYHQKGKRPPIAVSNRQAAELVEIVRRTLWQKVAA